MINIHFLSPHFVRDLDTSLGDTAMKGINKTFLHCISKKHLFTYSCIFSRSSGLSASPFPKSSSYAYPIAENTASLVDDRNSTEKRIMKYLPP
jgi:hypothetical protein